MIFNCQALTGALNEGIKGDTTLRIISRLAAARLFPALCSLALLNGCSQKDETPAPVSAPGGSTQAAVPAPTDEAQAREQAKARAAAMAAQYGQKQGGQ